VKRANSLSAVFNWSGISRAQANANFLRRGGKNLVRSRTFRYKQEIDPDRIPQFGLVAEEVEKVNPNLVVRDADGKVNTVRYEAVNAMLLNEFLKEHRKVEEQGAMIAKQQKQIEALTATVQKVSDQVAFRKPAPKLVANP